MDSTYFVDFNRQMLFSRQSQVESENLNKIWKSENPRWQPPVRSFIWILLPCKPIRHHVVSLNWKYKWSLLYVPNFKSIGWVVSKVEGGPIDPPLPPSRLRVTIFSRRIIGLTMKLVIVIIVIPWSAKNKTIHKFQYIYSYQKHLTIGLETFLFTGNWFKTSHTYFSYSLVFICTCELFMK